MSEIKQSELSKKLLILPYNTAYSKLIRYISHKYWTISAVKKDHKSPPDFFKALNLDLYKAKKGNNHLQGSGEEGRIRLNCFLDNIYKNQNIFKGEGCIVLLRWIDDVFKRKEGKNFPYILAKAVKEKFWMADSIMPSGAIELTGEKSKLLQNEIDGITARAIDIIYNYEYVPDYSQAFGVH